MYGQSCRNDDSRSYILVDCLRAGTSFTLGSRRWRINKAVKEVSSEEAVPASSHSGARTHAGRRNSEENPAQVHPVLYVVCVAVADISNGMQIKHLRGFDRLAAAGFTEEDIASIRQ
jgi:hypothetical protein